MPKFRSLLVLLACAVAQSQQAPNVTWVLRLPTTGVKEGETIPVELMPLTRTTRPSALDAPATLVGTWASRREGQIEMKRIGEAAKFVPSGGFVVMAYDMVVPAGGGRACGARAVADRSGPGVLRVLRPAPVSAPRPCRPPARTSAAVPDLHAAEHRTDCRARADDQHRAGKRLPTVSDTGTAEFIRNKLQPVRADVFPLRQRGAQRAKFSDFVR